MRPFRECFRGLLRMFRPHRGRVLLSIFIGMVGVGSSLGFVWISKKVVDVATGAAAGELMPFVLLMLGIMLLQIVCRVGGRYWEGLIVVKAQNSMRQEAFRKVMLSTWSGKDKLHSGDTVSRLEEDIRVLSRAHLAWVVRIKSASLESINCFMVNHLIKILVVPNLDLLNFVRCTETIKEVNERNSTLDCCTISNRC